MKKLLLLSFLLFACALQAQEQFEWVKTFGGPGEDEGYQCAVAPSGDLLFTGSYTDTMAMGNYLFESADNREMFVMKTNQQGELRWAAKAGGNAGYSTIGRAIDTDQNGNVYVGGNFRDSIRVGEQVFYGVDTEYHDNFLIKYDKDGNPLWTKIFKGPGGDCIEDLRVYGDHIVVTGY